MTDKTTLHQLIEELPESELLAAERFLAYLRDMADPVRRALLAAPWDDEPETEEERQAVQEAHEELVEGKTIPDTDLWRRLGHEPSAICCGLTHWVDTGQGDKGLKQKDGTDEHP